MDLIKFTIWNIWIRLCNIYYILNMYIVSYLAATLKFEWTHIMILIEVIKLYL